MRWWLPTSPRSRRARTAVSTWSTRSIRRRWGGYYLGLVRFGRDLQSVDRQRAPRSIPRAISTSRASACAATRSYNAFFTNYLGAQVIDIQTTDVYSALGRGTVDATGWTQIGLVDLRWDEFPETTASNPPSFPPRSRGVIANLESWNELTPEAQEILQGRRRSSTSAPASRPCARNATRTLPFSRSRA